MNIEFLKNKIAIFAYCPPQIPCEKNGISSPNKITDEQYKYMADAGVNVVLGHSEQIGSKDEEFVFKALELSKKYEMGYLVRDRISMEYVSLGLHDYKDFRKLTEQEKCDLDKRYAESLKRYKDFPAFLGVSFIDEPGSASFEGIKRAKKVFYDVCGDDKLFYVNLFPYYITAKQYEFGTNQTDEEPKTAGYEINEKRNINRYECYLSKFLETVKPQMFSYDAYPFCTLGNAHTAIHEVLYEMQQLGAKLTREQSIPYWLYMQCGGLWEGMMNVRVPTFAEMQLQVNLALMYGAKGIGIFPYCAPNDWLGDNNFVAALIDISGKKTAMYDSFSYAAKQIKAVENKLSTAKLKAIMKNGKYENMLPTKEELAKIKWSECIYQGELPQYGNMEVASYGELILIESSSEVLVGCFETENANAFYLVNNSAVTSTNVRLCFDAVYSFECTYCGRSEKKKQNYLEFNALSAGEGVLISLGVKKE